MKSKNCAALVAGMLVVVLHALCISGCNGGASAPPPPPPLPISVSFSLATATVNTNLTAQFTATVSNDPSNKGVTWAVSCSAPPCGTVSPTSTASGASTTYTPPSTVASSLSVNITAASASDPTKSQTVPITVYPPIAVSVSPSADAIPAGATATFAATLTNDGANKGVSWTATCSAPSCGSFSPASSLSGNTTTYTAPSNPPPGVLTVTITATSVTDTSKTGAATITTSSITVAITPPNGASVQSGGTQQFTATVSNDPSNGGVTWSVARHVCNPLTGKCVTSSCSTCGTVSPTATASGVPVTYTAPSGPFSIGSVLLQANSVTYNAALNRAPITILPISVSVSPSPASVALNISKQFSATVTNDGTNRGVTWSLTQNGVACAPGCGTIAPATTASNAPATYTAPASAPSLPLVTVTATSVEDTTKSGTAMATLTTSTGALACDAGTGNESMLKGQFAFLLQGSGNRVIAGSFTADGTGKITGGEADVIGGPSESDVSINASVSAYAVGPDRRGCLVLADASGETPAFRFALGSLNPTNIAMIGHIVEVANDARFAPAGVAGIFRLQDATSFTASQFKGAYVYGVVGGGVREATAGTFASDGISALTSSELDFNSAGNVTSSVSSSPGGNFTCCSANGRGTLQINGGTNLGNFPFVMYMINSSEAFLESTNSITGGEAFGIPSGTTFTQASLNGASVLRETGQSSTGPVVDVATISSDGKTAMTVNDNINNGGTFTTSSTALNFTVASNGRVAFTGSSTPPVMYLYGPNQGFLIGTDADVTFGILEPQAAGLFSNASFSGTYLFGTENPYPSTVSVESGVLTADGKGNASGTSDQSSSAGLTLNQSLNFAYSFPASGVGNVGSGTTAILISGNKLVFISNTSPNPTITVVEK